jgi:hypothetical protein
VASRIAKINRKHQENSMDKVLSLSSRTGFRVALSTVLVILILTFAYSSGRAKTVPMTVRGVVAGSYFTPPSGATASRTSASYYQNAKVCVDDNNNAVCDPDETSAMTDQAGTFFLHSLHSGPVVAEISTTSTNSDQAVTQRVSFRASSDQVAEGAVNAGHAAVPTPAAADIVITPLSTEVVRMMEADNIDYQTAKWNLARRLNVSVDEVLDDPGNLPFGPFQAAVLSESVILTNRFELAARMVDRHDVSPLLSPSIRMQRDRQ